MDRRTLVKYLVGASAAGTLAGCISAEESDGGDGDGDGDGGSDGNGSDGDGSDGADGNDNGGYELLEPEEGVAGTAELWHDREDAEQQLLEAVVEEFNGEYEPTIRLNQVADIDDRTRTAIPAGEGPEGFEWAHDWAGKYWEEGLLSDQSGNLRVDREIFAFGADAIEWDGHAVGLPHSAETVSLLYNRELVDEPPETIAEMQEIMEEHHDPDGGTYGLGYPLNAYAYSAWAHAFGGYYYDDESDALGITNEETVAGLELVVDELFPYMPRDYGYEAQASTFQSGNAPFSINGPWAVGNLDFDFGVAPLPSPEGGEPEPYTGVSMLYFAADMDEDEERAAAARSFVEWFVTNVDVHRRQAEEVGLIPAHVALSDAEETDEAIAGFTTDLERGRPMPQSPKMDAVWVPVEEEFEEALNGNKSVADAMADAETRIRDNWDE